MDIDHYLKRLFPIQRSITGSGTRQTLKILQEIVPFQILEYPSGKKVYDWIIPKEWNIRGAWIKNAAGEKIVDLKNNNLHVVGYSRPVSGVMSFDQLVPHLHYRKDLSGAIPYRTSYYIEDWGFCLSHDDFERYFRVGEEFEVFIDSSLTDGYLNVGEILIPGKCSTEYLISTYICHPSMANDNLSGMVLTAFLAKELIKRDLQFSYRIVFVPETIGAIAYCADHEAEMSAIGCGLVISCVGGPGKFGYKQSFNAHHFVNRAIEEVFRETSTEYITYPFDIDGSDERQYASPGLRINMASITKDKYYEYAYYHTSLDDLNYVTPHHIYESLMIYLQIVDTLDKNLTYERIEPFCEIMLSKHRLYPAIGGKYLPLSNGNDDLNMILWLLFYCDGHTDLFEIADRMNMPIHRIFPCARLLEEQGIIRPKLSNSPIRRPGYRW